MLSLWNFLPRMRMSKQIEKAQQKVEEQRFLERKHTLEYDDVANAQREVIYAYRNSILNNQEFDPPLRERPLGVADKLVDQYLRESDFVEDWDYAGLERRVHEVFNFEFEIPARADGDIDELKRVLRENVKLHFEEMAAAWPPTTLPLLERHVALTVIDSHWQQLLADLDYLRAGIGLRGHAQIDPIVAYKNSAYELFGEVMDDIWVEFAFTLTHINVTFNAPTPTSSEADDSADAEDVSRSPTPAPADTADTADTTTQTQAV